MSRIVARPNHAVSDQQTKWQRVRCAVCVVWCYINNTWREPWSVELRRPYLSQHNNASYHNKLKPVVLFRIFRCFAFSFTLTLFRACIVWLTYFFSFWHTTFRWILHLSLSVSPSHSLVCTEVTRMSHDNLGFTSSTVSDIVSTYNLLYSICFCLPFLHMTFLHLLIFFSCFLLCMDHLNKMIVTI